ncbi:hypothetical protein ABPG75_001666 [Micractinium tetrahymenae]
MALRFTCLALLLAVSTGALAAPAKSTLPTNYAFAFEWGDTSGDGTLNFPMGVAVNRDRTKVFVCDAANSRIAVFNPDNGAFLLEFGSSGSGPGQFATPVNVAISPRTGHIYVTDPQNSRVVVYDEQGVFIRNFGVAGTGPGQFDGVVDVGLDDSGNVFILTNTRMQKYSGWGKFIMEWSMLAASDPQTFAPGGMGINQVTMEVYVLDYANDWVKRYNGVTGKFLSKIGGTPGVFAETIAITADAQGGVYVLDTNNTNTAGKRSGSHRGLLQATPKPTMRIQKFDGPTGQLLVAFGSYGSGPGQMVSPYGITTTRNGFWVFATDTVLNKVIKYSLPFKAGGWADPHFQGFDGKRFDAHGQPNSWMDLLIAKGSKMGVRAKLATGLMPGSTYMVDVAFTFAGAKYRGTLVNDGTAWALTATLNGSPLKVGTSWPVAGTKVTFNPGATGKNGRLQIEAGQVRIVVAQMWRADRNALADYLNVGIDLRSQLVGDVTGILAPSYYNALRLADQGIAGQVGAAAVRPLALSASTV